MADFRIDKSVFTEKSIIIFEIFLYLLTFSSLIYYIIQGNSQKVFKCFIMASLLLTYRFLPRLMNIDLHNLLKIFIMTFIFLAIFLAEILNFYKRISFYDKILHSLSGVLFFFVGRSLFRRVNNLYEKSKENPLLMVLFSLFFSLSVAGCWEIFEFSMDRIFGLMLQNNSLIDTMTDIICATCTASLTSVFTYLAVRSKKEIIETEEGKNTVSVVLVSPGADVKTH